MSLPLLMLVDDSEAILAYEKAALSGLYTFVTANNGRDAWNKLKDVQPALICLDLSMPEMTGDELLGHIVDSPMKDTPVIIISSERERGMACLKKGASAFLPKPFKADDLRAQVARLLDETKAKARKKSMAVLIMTCGPYELGLPLEAVKAVLLQPATQPLAGAPSYLSEMIDLHGQPIVVLDVPRVLRVEHVEERINRKLVVIQSKDALLALCVDRVRDPEEFTQDEIVPRNRLLGEDAQLLAETLSAVVRSSRGPLPVMNPAALVARKYLRHLPNLLKSMHGTNPSPPQAA